MHARANAHTAGAGEVKCKGRELGTPHTTSESLTVNETGRSNLQCAAPESVGAVKLQAPLVCDRH